MQWRLVEQAAVREWGTTQPSGTATGFKEEIKCARSGIDCVPRPYGLGLKQRLLLQWENQSATKRISNPPFARYFNKRQQGIGPVQ